MLMTALKSAARTDPGRIRRNNEDAHYTDPDRGIYLVVDGIGGHNAGEKAAAIAVEFIRARMERPSGAPETRIREAIAIANNEILKAARSNPEWDGMACVLTLALIEGGTAYIGHVGDSRLYCLRNGKIRKLTRDHSPVGEREDAGELGEAEAMRHPRRNEVFRDVGSQEHAPDDSNFIDVFSEPFDAETALLLCSDGLSDLVTSEEMRRIVEAHAGDPDLAARELIDAANAAGGKDNVTVVLVEGERFKGLPAASAVAPKHSRLWPIMAAIFNVAFAAAVIYALYKPKPPVIIEPRTLVVGPGAAYDTIAAAMAAARAGDTVEALSGEYREHVFLKTGIALRSREPREARIIAAPGNNTAVSASGVEHSRLEGFLIAADPQNPLEIGIAIQDSSTVILNTEIEGAATGVQITGPRTPELTADAIHDCSVAGVAIEGLVNPWLFHNTFQRDKAAILVQGEAKPQLVGNVFEKAPFDLPAGLAAPVVREHNFLLDLKTPTRPSPASTRKGKE